MSTTFIRTNHRSAKKIFIHCIFGHSYGTPFIYFKDLYLELTKLQLGMIAVYLGQGPWAMYLGSKNKVELYAARYNKDGHIFSTDNNLQS